LLLKLVGKSQPPKVTRGSKPPITYQNFFLSSAAITGHSSICCKKGDE